MKKILIWAMVLTGILSGACTNEDDGVKPGSIYGIVTELGTAEPMKAIGVELYKSSSLLLKTVTFDDGHFEFNELTPGNYQVKVLAAGYLQTEEGVVTVEAGRQARIDLQVKKMEVGAIAYTSSTTISGNQVTLNGEYTKDPNTSVIETGFIYGSNNNPQDGGAIIKCKKDEIIEKNGAYKLSVTINDLRKGTYYYQAYVKTSNGTAYGETLSFKFSVVPIVTTLPPTNVFAQTATLNGRIEAEGDPAYTEHGFVYSKFFNRPTVDDPSDATTRLSVSGHSNDFSANVSSLTENATYYVRAYATNEGGTVYGEAISFTLTTLPIVTTLEATNVLPTSATLHGRIDNAGEPPYTERGFVYSSSYQIPAVGDPTSATTKVIVEGTSQEFHANISSLEKGYTYYVRAYATSHDGTSYGDVQTFKYPDYVVIDNLMIQTEDLGLVNWNSAKLLCENSRVSGFSDWRLPTKEELSTIYTNRNSVPNLTSGNYWSSSKTADYYSSHYYIDFSTGMVYSAYDSDNKLNVRAVRIITQKQ